MRVIPWVLAFTSLLTAAAAPAQTITAARQPAQLDIRAAGHDSLRITLKPVGFAGVFLVTLAVIDRAYPAPTISLRDLAAPVKRPVGTLHVEVRATPRCARSARSPSGGGRSWRNSISSMPAKC